MHEHAWMCMNMHECAWTYMNVHEHAWMCMNVHECAWTCMNVHERAWTCMNVHECAWMCMNVHECAWTCMNLHEYAWVCMNVLEYVWNCRKQVALACVEKKGGRKEREGRRTKILSVPSMRADANGLVSGFAWKCLNKLTYNVFLCFQNKLEKKSIYSSAHISQTTRNWDYIFECDGQAFNTFRNAQFPTAWQNTPGTKVGSGFCDRTLDPP